MNAEKEVRGIEATPTRKKREYRTNGACLAARVVGAFL